MKSVILILVLIHLAACETSEPTPVHDALGSCQCAAFQGKSDGMGEPVISKKEEHRVACTDEGKNMCLSLCITLAALAQDFLPKILCAKLDGNVGSLKPAAYFKACNDPEWTFTGLSSAEPICCQKNEVVPCKETEA